MLPSPVRLTTRPVMYGYGRINQITTKCAQARQCSVLVGASEPAVSDHVCGQDCCEFPSFDHGTLCAVGIVAQSLRHDCPKRTE